MIPYIICLLVLFLQSCSSPPLLPLNNRIPIYISPPAQLASDYIFVTPPFDVQVRALLYDPLVSVQDYGADGALIATFQNPVVPSQDSAGAHLILESQVERISYEPASNVESRIAAYAFGGLSLMWLTGSGDDLAAQVQYRFQLYDANHKLLSEFLAVGAASGDVNQMSRLKLTKQANVVALSTFCAQLFRIIEMSARLSLDYRRGSTMSPKQRRSTYEAYIDSVLSRNIRIR